jgi:hypothetical protein
MKNVTRRSMKAKTLNFSEGDENETMDDLWGHFWFLPNFARRIVRLACRPRQHDSRQMARHA